MVVVDGSFHPVDSDQLSFEVAAQMAYKAICALAKAVLEEVKGRADLV